MKEIAIIGSTGFATERMIPEIQNSKTCRVVAIQGRNPQKLEEVCKKFSISNYFTEIEKMMEFRNYDAVYIANPPFLHKETVEKIAKYNLPILCEKPLVFSVKELNEIENLLENSTSQIMVGHHIRHQKAIQDLKKILEEKRIGNIQEVKAEWSYYLNKEAPYAKWKLNPQLGGHSSMNDAGIHIIDIVHLLFSKPKSIKSEGYSKEYQTTIDTAHAILDYGNFSVDIICSQAEKNPRNDLIIQGDKGSILIKDFFSQEYIKEITINTSDNIEKIHYEKTFLYLNEIENLLGISQKGVPGCDIQSTKENTQILETIHTEMKEISR